MSDEQFYLREEFFKFLRSIEELKTKKDKMIFLESLLMSEDDFLKYCEFLRQYDVKVLFDKSYIYPLYEIKKINFELRLSEWFALHSILKNSNKLDFTNDLVKNKLVINQTMPERNIQKIEVKKTEEKQFAYSLEKCLIDKNIISIKFSNGKLCDLIPLRVVYLDGILSLIGEKVVDHILIYLSLEEIVSFEKIKNTEETRISQIEVNEFISNLRLVNGNEERLVLKLYSPEESDILPRNHFLGNPFVTSNPEGDMIWAASIEICEDVYSWLYSIKDKVEILDPVHIRREFALYVDSKNENLKKIS